MTMKIINRIFIKTLLLALIFVAAGRSEATELTVEGLDSGIRQGDAALVRITSTSPLESLAADFNGNKIYFQHDSDNTFTGILGAGMDMKPGEYEIYISGKSPAEAVYKNFRFTVNKRDYRVERLTLPKRMVTPDRSVIERIRRESKALGNVKKMINSERFWEGEFIKPVVGTISDNFGSRRVLNGVSKKPHSGVDVKAYAGTQIKSPNAGRVIYVDVMYYGGKTVVIDHGHGLSTLYMHLSKILVNHGEEVEKGEVIGLVGSTGRSTGPHLHWGAYLYSQKVDPASLLRLSADNTILAEEESYPAEYTGEEKSEEKAAMVPSNEILGGD